LVHAGGFFFTAYKGWAPTLQVTFWWSTLWQVESRHRSQPGGGFFTKMLLKCREIPAGKLKRWFIGIGAASLSGLMPVPSAAPITAFEISH
jgi:hypothetical protein